MLNVVHRGLGLACAAKAIDLALRARGVVVLWPLVLTVWIVATCCLLRSRWVPRAAGAIAIMSLGMPVLTLGAMQNQHLYLLGSIAAIVALLRPAEQLVCFRLQLSAMYLFAALAKLNPVWLGGGVLETLFDRSALGRLLPDATFEPLAIAVVVVELFLVIGFWLPRTRRLSIALGVALHASIPFAIASDLATFSQYVAFGIAAVALYPAHLIRPVAGNPIPAQRPSSQP